MESIVIKWLLEKAETRIDIFNNVIENEELMLEFMKIMKRTKGLVMMKENHQMMGFRNRLGVMKENPQLIKKLLPDIIEICQKDPVICNNMADMVTDNPVMMEMCIQKMKEKGMTGPDGEKKMKNSVY